MFRKRLTLSEVKHTKKYIVKETGAFCCYTLLDEYQSLEFLLKAQSFNIKNEVKVSSFIGNDKSKIETLTMNFEELGQHISNELVISVEITESEFAIVLSAAELWIYSFDEDLAESIFKTLWYV